MAAYNGQADGAHPPKKRTHRVTDPAIFTFRLDPELKNLLGEAADKEEVPLNEYMAKILAKSIGRPDLAKIPRKSMGRPRNVEEVPA